MQIANNSKKKKGSIYWGGGKTGQNTVAGGQTWGLGAFAPSLYVKRGPAHSLFSKSTATDFMTPLLSTCETLWVLQAIDALCGWKVTEVKNEMVKSGGEINII